MNMIQSQSQFPTTKSPTRFAIYVVQHKPCEPLDDPNFVQIFVGPESVAHAQSEGRAADDDVLYDSTGDNISAKNDSYCELTAMYWAWKNAPRSDFIGFMHYRRHLNFSGIDAGQENIYGLVDYSHIDQRYQRLNGLDATSVETLLKKNDLLLPRKWSVNNVGSKNLYDHFHRGPAHKGEDYDRVLEIMTTLYPEYAREARKVNASTEGYFTNMFVMRRALFDDYCAWLFSILGRLELELDTSIYSAQQKRVFGFLSEWLFNIFIEKYLSENHDVKVAELQRTFVQYPEKAEIIHPAFGLDAVPLVLSFDEKFTKYAAAMLNSIKQHASPARRYDLVILNKDISSKNKALISGMFAGLANFSVRFFDIRKYVHELNLPVHAHFSEETYFRLLIPQFFVEYPKVIYLDSDMVALRDLGDLLDIDIGDNLVAAVNDCVMEGMRLFQIRSLDLTGSLPAQKYLENYLKLERPEDYFQAGLIIFNNQAIVKTDYLARTLSAIKDKVYWFLDQDIINTICQGKVFYLDMRWNTFFGNGDTETFFEDLPKATRDTYFNALRAPYVLHFAGERKPWKHLGIAHGHAFWRYCRGTPWYEEVFAEAVNGAVPPRHDGRSPHPAPPPREVVYITPDVTVRAVRARIKAGAAPRWRKQAASWLLSLTKRVGRLPL